MKIALKNKLSYTCGAVRRSDLAYLAYVSDELVKDSVSHAYITGWHKQEWYKAKTSDLEWTVADISICTIPISQAILLGQNGEAFCLGSGDEHVEIIADGQPERPETRGMMSGMNSIEGKAYAVGMARQCYRRDGANKWTCIDQGARPAKGDKNTYGFNAIDGFSAKDFYAVGWKGEIWHCDGKDWEQIDSPTNLILTRVCCAGDGKVYACGRLGTLVCGRGSEWEVIAKGGTESDIWGMAWYKDHLYIATMRELFRLEEDKLVPMEFGKDKPRTFYTLSAADGVMWSIGSKDVMSFDGKNWTRID